MGTPEAVVAEVAEEVGERKAELSVDPVERVVWLAMFGVKETFPLNEATFTQGGMTVTVPTEPRALIVPEGVSTAKLVVRASRFSRAKDSVPGDNRMIASRF
jgi:hypothetical protein